jgi:hypothetical protein
METTGSNCEHLLVLEFLLDTDVCVLTTDPPSPHFVEIPANPLTWLILWPETRVSSEINDFRHSIPRIIKNRLRSIQSTIPLSGTFPPLCSNSEAFRSTFPRLGRSTSLWFVHCAFICSGFCPQRDNRDVAGDNESTIIQAKVPMLLQSASLSLAYFDFTVSNLQPATTCRAIRFNDWRAYLLQINRHLLFLRSQPPSHINCVIRVKRLEIEPNFHSWLNPDRVYIYSLHVTEIKDKINAELTKWNQARNFSRPLPVPSHWTIFSHRTKIQRMPSYFWGRSSDRNQWWTTELSTDIVTIQIDIVIRSVKSTWIYAEIFMNSEDRWRHNTINSGRPAK